MDPSVILADHSWWHTHGETVVWIAAVVAALGVIIKTPIGQFFLRAVKWIWQRLVSEPITDWGTRTVGAVVESKVAGKNGGSSLRDQIDLLNDGQRALMDVTSLAADERTNISKALSNIHLCLDTRFADTHARMEKLTEYAEEVLAEAVGAKERIRQLYRALDTPVFETNAQGWCTYINPAYSRLTGLSVEESLGEGWGEAVDPEDRDRVFATWATAVEENVEFTAIYRFRNVVDGRVTEVRGSAVPLRDGRGDVAGWVGSVDPIGPDSRVERRPQATMVSVTATAQQEAESA